MTGFKDLPDSHPAIVDDRWIDLGKCWEELSFADFPGPRAMRALNRILGFIPENRATPQNDVTVPLQFHQIGVGHADDCRHHRGSATFRAWPLLVFLRYWHGA